jgi:hypothetical protein
MSKSFVVVIRKDSQTGPVVAVTNQLVYQEGTGNIEASDFTDSTLTGNVAISNYVGTFTKTAITVSTTTTTTTAAPGTTTTTTAGPGAYSIVRSASSINEGQSVTFTLNTQGVAFGNVVPYTITGVTSDDISGAALTGNLVVGSSPTLTLTATEDFTTEGQQTITVTLGGPALGAAPANCIINDTSTTQSGTAYLSISGSYTNLQNNYILPKAATWVMFRMIGAGGGGGGYDRNSNGGNGGSGHSIRGIVRLPATPDTKVLQGGVGSGGGGGISASPGSGGGVGGTGYSWPTSGLVSQRDGTGGAGGNAGASKWSGAGGGGGGSTSLGYFITGVNSEVPISATGGGGGGGGGSDNVSSGNNQQAKTTDPTWLTVRTLTSTIGTNGSRNPGDGGGGGGGGGGAGTGGAFGSDNQSTGGGGLSGRVMRNYTVAPLTNADWNYFDVEPTGAGTIQQGLNTAAARTQNFFGWGGDGAVYETLVSQVGQRGAIAVYWTTSATAPSDWNLVPDYPIPSDIIVVISTTSYSVSQDTNSGLNPVVFLSFSSAGSLVTPSGLIAWTSSQATRVGELFQIRATIIAGNSSNLQAGYPALATWLDMATTRTWTFTSSSSTQMTMQIEIRSKSTQQILGTAFYTLNYSVFTSAQESGGPE